MEAVFKAGDLAQIRSTGEVVTINAVSPGMSQIYYLVFQNGKKNRYKESELMPYVDEEQRILSKLREGRFANAESFQKYAYYRLFSENQEGNIYSYQGNKIIFNPFQYKPLLKFLSVDSDERLLIADEVGVGKTIESGIIIDELLARGELKSRDAVLIVCPSILCRKWRTELRNKFSLDDFFIHDGNSLTYMLAEILETGRVPHSHSIASEQLFRGEKYQELLRQCMDKTGEPIFRLLIMDECHHYRNPGTNTHQIGMLLSLSSERVLMLSATPFNLRSDDLYYQLHILNPALFPEQQIFTQLLRQVRTVNQAVALVKKSQTGFEDLLLERVTQLKKIADEHSFMKDDYAVLYDKMIRGEKLTVQDKVDFERVASMLNPIATSFTRTLKRDALEHRVTRETLTLEVHFSEQETDIYRSFLETSLLRYRMLGISERAFGLILNGLERIAASSLAALEKNIRHFIDLPEESFIEEITDGADIAPRDVKGTRQLLWESYSDLLEKISLVGDNDSKYVAFRRLIEDVRQASGENRRMLVFSFYTETLKYLRRKLTADGYRVALMYGKTPEDTHEDQVDEDGFGLYGRADIMRDFEQGIYDILLVSEVGGEGLDFQFCTALINYDLPYNPMRIEQRIGRIDRMGQEADKIIIGNLCIADTIDVMINRILLSRIAEATDLVGDLEPIIAKEFTEINALMITRDFTEEELKQREWELEQRIERSRQTRAAFEEERYELVNDKGFREEFEETVKKSRISPREALLFTCSFLKKENGCWCKPISDSSALIHITKNLRDQMRGYLRKMDSGPTSGELQMLAGHDGDLVIDFDGSAAYADRGRTFFKPSGAFIHFVLNYIRAVSSDNPENVFHAAIKKELLNGISAGSYWIFVYEMAFQGFHSNKSYEYILVNPCQMQTVCLEDEQKKLLFQGVKTGKAPFELPFDLFNEAMYAAENAAERRKEEIMEELMGRNRIKIGSRIQAVQNLSHSRILALQNELGIAGETEEKILKAMKREKERTNAKIAILEEKLRLSGTYALDAVCQIDIT
ncbi:MAG: DEAD/DEAH box helicase family protein [Acidaminococcaceae bacterium]|nr:DEAD/DEAH box helicase family protein [Acidaminococcaceae bacterium]